MALDPKIALERAAVEAKAALHLASSPEVEDKLVAVLICQRLIRDGLSHHLPDFRAAKEALAGFMLGNDLPLLGLSAAVSDTARLIKARGGGS